MMFKINHKFYSRDFFLKKNQIDLFEKENEYGKELFLFLSEWFSEKNEIEITTSGSTGKPKLFKVEKWKLEASANRTLVHFNLKKGSSFLLCLPLNFIAGKLMVVRALINEGNIITKSPSSKPLNFNTEIIDFGALTPMQLSNSIKNFGIENITIINKLLIGGARVSEDLIQNLHGYKGEVFETFGMTETLTHFALKKCFPTKEKSFKVLPEINIETSENKLIVKSKSFLQENIFTTDIIEILSPNEFIWLGRADFTINTGGLKVQPEAIEEKLNKGLNFAFFISKKPDELLGEKVIICVKEGNKNLIKKELFQNLNKFEKPKSIIELKEFPFSNSGKILRKELEKTVLNLLEWPI